MQMWYLFVHVCMTDAYESANGTYILSCDENICETVLLIIRALVVLHAPSTRKLALCARCTPTIENIPHVTNGGYGTFRW